MSDHRIGSTPSTPFAVTASTTFRQIRREGLEGTRTRMPGHAAARLCFGFALLFGTACAQTGIRVQPPAEYREAGRSALEWTRKFVDLGPRAAGSEALATQATMVVEALSELSCQVEVDQFVAATPVGALWMRNIIARFGPPSSPQVVVVSGHYDTLRMDGFLGANDGGSSAGLLMALAERLNRIGLGAVWLVFFDGEESTVAWRDGDHTYGSRRLAEKWAADGTSARIRGLINVDMIGDGDLQLVYEGNSDSALRDTVWTLAGQLGYQDVFRHRIGYIQDDHIPFLEVGIPSLDLIDFDYGPGNSHWHTLDDTIDKLDEDSFATILHVLEESVVRVLAE